MMIGQLMGLLLLTVGSAALPSDDASMSHAAPMAVLLAEPPAKPADAPPTPATTPADAKPTESSTMTGAPEPQIRGYDPTAYKLDKKAIKGDPAHKSVHNGEIYYFSTAERKQMFDKDPKAYIPEYNGICSLALGGSFANRFPCDPERFEVHNGKVYLLSSTRAQRAFVTKPDEYIKTANEVWSQPAWNGLCLVTLVKEGKQVNGSPSHATAHGRWQYFFASEDARKEFEKNPETYVPIYMGKCAYAISQGKNLTATPKHAKVIHGRVHFFLDEGAAEKFAADPANLRRAADESWAKIMAGIKAEEAARFDKKP